MITLGRRSGPVATVSEPVGALTGDFFRLSMEPSAVLGSGGELLDVNSAWAQVVGSSPDAVVGSRIIDHVHHDDVSRAGYAIERLGRGEMVEGLRIRIVHGDGGHRWMEWLARPVADTGRSVATFRDITSVRKTEDSLRRARDEAMRASRSKSDFLSRMSHELRTPLNSIIGFGQLLEMEDLTSQQAQHVSYILKSGRHLLDLINEVLDVVRIEGGNMKMSVEPVVLADALTVAVEMTRPLATARTIEVSCDLPSRGMAVVADEQRLLQVLLNLLSNAIKYSEPGDAVSVTTEASGGTVIIAVTDTGPGISDSDQEKLFTPFERLDADNSDVEGSGIGLPVARALSREMGGTLTVSSQLGVGSTFCLELLEVVDNGAVDDGAVDDRI